MTRTCTRTGDAAVYVATTEAMPQKVQAKHDQDALANVVWLQGFRGGPLSQEKLGAATGADAERVDAAVKELLSARSIDAALSIALRPCSGVERG